MRRIGSPPSRLTRRLNRKIETMSFSSLLSKAWARSNSLLCVGLDPDLAKFPPHLRGRPDAVFEFGREIIDATADFACAFKPQIAYYAALRAEDQLEATIRYLKEKHPAIPVVLDAKRGDIGSTAEQYAREVFERYRADAVTVSPYLGYDSVTPYLAYEGKGVIVLCRTSNPGGSDLQFLEIAGVPLYQHVARLVAEKWDQHGQCALVVGATYPKEIAAVRAIIGNMPLLVPGIGAQGGDIEATVKAGQTANGTGLIINSGRAILYSTDPRAAAQATRDAINQYRIK